jgi:dGTPase
VSPAKKSIILRSERLISKASDLTASDTRSHFQRDRDRVLYSDAFRRLSDVTQVVGSSEAHPFHNRLTHTLEVAQIARRISERILQNFKKKYSDIVKHLDPDVVEAAALAHDLGHPPFGHAAETELNELMLSKDYLNPEGFEGNAQTFRILNTLAPHRPHYYGLDLCRATLNAVIKYPNLRDIKDGASKHQKFNAYSTERKQYDFARELSHDSEQSLEASIMDYSDDVSYSVHDFFDFYRVGLLQLDNITASNASIQKFYTSYVVPKINEKSLTITDKEQQEIDNVLSLLPKTSQNNNKRIDTAIIQA